MKIRSFIACIIIFATVPLFAGESKTVADFSLEDYNGSKYTLSNFDESKAVVLMFISSRCPISNAYNERMNELYKLYTPKDITFLGINSNKTESKQEIEEHTREQGFQFPVLVDKNNEVADQFDAKVTPEIFVVNADLELLYHGRIDDSKDADNVKSHDLYNALTAIVKDKPVPVKTTKAFGCSIKRIEASSN